MLEYTSAHWQVNVPSPQASWQELIDLSPTHSAVRHKMNDSLYTQYELL